MGRRTPRGWQVWFLSLGLLACDGTAVDMGTPAVINPPSPCAGDPTCYESADFPDSDDLNAMNSSGLRYSGSSGGLVMSPTNVLADADGDGVPDIADDCNGMDDWVTCNNDTDDDGEYQTLYYDTSGTGTVSFTQVGDLPSQLSSVDVYFLIDASETMDGEIGTLQASIAAILGNLQSEFSDPQFGVGFYREYGLDPHADPFTQSPFHHVLDITSDTSEVMLAINPLGTATNLDNVDAGSQALFMAATGTGVSTFVPNRLDCPAGTYGYPCFRDGVFPVIVNLTDDRMTNGPDPTGPQYGNPPFDGSVGAAFPMPPAYIMPLTGSDDTTDAVDLGDLAGAPVTLMGMSNNTTNFVDASAIPSCTGCGGMGCEEDWKDVVVRFHWSSVVNPAAPNAILWAWNTHFPAAYVAVWEDSAAPGLAPGSAVACSHIDFTGNSNWGEPVFAINTAVDYFAAVDGLIPAAEPTATPEGAYQLLIFDASENLASHATWLTHSGPMTWTEVDTELNAAGIKIASIISPRLSGMPTSDGLQDALDLANETGSVDSNGFEYVQTIDFDGTGLATAIADVFDQVVSDTRRDFTVTLFDDPATPEDERDFINYNLVCPTTGARTCTGKTGTDQCDQCESGTPIEIELEYLNDFVPPTGSDQLFETQAVLAVDGYEVFTVPFRFVVPAAAASYAGGVGIYQQADIDSASGFCNIPNERPDWGILTWTGSTPGGSLLQVAVYTANSTAELDTVTPLRLTVPVGFNYDIGLFLPLFGFSNGLSHIRLVAELNPSGSGAATPIFEGWDFSFNCVPAF